MIVPPPALREPPQRIVSLVPSATESLFELGFGAAVAGATDFCIHPAEKTAGLPKVGGTKNARPEDILALQPDLIIANREENTPETVHALQDSGSPVWLTFPQTADDAVQLLYDLAGMFRSQTAMLAVRSLAMSLDYARSAAEARSVRVFCPVWFDRLADGTPWWMAFNRETYPHDILSLLGGVNVCAGRTRRYPLDAELGRAPEMPVEGRDTRYPRVGIEEIRAAEPELVLLPSEPYAFGEGDRELLESLLPEGVTYRFIDGSLLTWHGTRLAKALRFNLV